MFSNFGNVGFFGGCVGYRPRQCRTKSSGLLPGDARLLCQGQGLLPGGQQAGLLRQRHEVLHERCGLLFGHAKMLPHRRSVL